MERAAEGGSGVKGECFFLPFSFSKSLHHGMLKREMMYLFWMMW